MNGTSLIFVIITVVLLGVGWVAINKKEPPGNYRKNAQKPRQ